MNKVNAECDRVKDCTDESDEEGCGKTRQPSSKLFHSSSHLRLHSLPTLWASLSVFVKTSMSWHVVLELLYDAKKLIIVTPNSELQDSRVVGLGYV